MGPVAVGVRQETGELHAVLLPEVDVDQRDVGSELSMAAHGVGGRGGDADHPQPVTFEDPASRLQKRRVVIDEEEAQGHGAGSA